MKLEAFTVAGGLVAKPQLLALSQELTYSVHVTGTNVLLFSFEACDGGTTVGRVTRSTRFPEIDRVLVERVPLLGIRVPIESCAEVTISLRDFMQVCDWR